MSLIGNVIQVHNDINPEKIRLFKVVDGPNDLDNGKINRATVELWGKHGLRITQFEETLEVKKRKPRKNLTELYGADVEEIANLVASATNSYVDIEAMDKQTAMARAFSDFSFWYGKDEGKEKALEKAVMQLIVFDK